MGAGKGNRLQGIAASAGSYSGTARVLRKAAEMDDLVDGEVLVVRASDPTWTVGMLRSGAIVTELGGPICHAAIVARELGLPAVVAVENVTQLVATGARVTVDGTEGTVSIQLTDD
jgi:phosphoenolpyruvate synthase/pyruvate phosphate dikinase